MKTLIRVIALPALLTLAGCCAPSKADTGDSAEDTADTGRLCMPETAPIWYFDGDGDGWGDDATAEQACTSPSPAHQSQGGDCDDSDRSINPDVADVFGDGVDSDCDGVDG